MGRFPHRTLIINILGASLWFLRYLDQPSEYGHPRWRLLVVVGFCGSSLLFPSYAFETDVIFRAGAMGLMVTNILTNNLLSLCAALGGMAWRDTLSMHAPADTGKLRGSIACI